MWDIQILLLGIKHNITRLCSSGCNGDLVTFQVQHVNQVTLKKLMSEELVSGLFPL